MTSAFFGLDMALRALHAQQNGIDVTNHNVSNANTKGFSRQNVNIVATDPFAMPAMNRPATAGQLGTGAIVNDIQRARDMFLDAQYRSEAGALKNAEARQDALEQVEVVLDEPQGVGLNALFNEYYRVWNELSNDPSASALPVRTTVVQQSLSLTGAINRIAGQLATIRTGLDGEVQTNIAEVNDITAQIFALNETIVQVEISGDSANDFRDQRDVLVDRLSELVSVTVNENANGSMNVMMGAQVLVNGNTAKSDLFAVPNAGNSNFVDIHFGSAAGPAATVGTAEIGGQLSARDTAVTGYQAQLDTIAANLITAMNTLHTAGFDVNGNPGTPFFTGTNASTIDVNAAIQANPSLIAAADTAGAPGNNEIALKISSLRTSMAAVIPPLAVGTPTSQIAYNSLVAGLGTDSRAARTEAGTQQSLVDLLDRRRQALSGVSLDEEAISLIRYQRAYEAAARVLTAYDQILEKLINSTGVVGR